MGLYGSGVRFFRNRFHTEGLNSHRRPDFSKLLNIQLMTLLAGRSVPARAKTWLRAALKPFTAINNSSPFDWYRKNSAIC